MFDRDKWLEILTTMLKNPLRTILTSISVAVGIFILIILLGLGKGLQNGAMDSFADDAMNSIWVRSGRTSLPYGGYQSNRRITYKDQDRQEVAEKIEGIEKSSARLMYYGTRTIYKNQLGNFILFGVHPAFQDLEKIKLKTGRYLNQGDIVEHRKIAVIGGSVIDDLFKKENPLGKYLEVKGVKFLVVGTYNNPNSRWENKQIHIPITTAQQLFGSNSDRIKMFVVGTGESTFDEAGEIATEIDSYLRSEYKVHPKDRKGIRINNMNEKAKMFHNIFLGIDIFVTLMGILTLMVGIIGVSNIMSIVVRERRREIGVRKALGARPWSIISLIIQESVMMTLISGLIGFLLGFAALQLIANNIENDYFKDPKINLNLALMAIGILVFAGTMAGLFPAIRAARTKPIEALKEE